MPFDTAPSTVSNHPELGFLATDYFETYILGPAPRFVAVRVCGLLPLEDSAQIGVKTDAIVKETRTTPDFKRQVGNPDPPQRVPDSFVNVQFNPVDIGQEVPWDANQADVRGLKRMGGAARVLQEKTLEAIASTYEGLDTDLAALVDAGTDPWTNAAGASSEVSAASARWDVATPVGKAVIRDAVQGLGRRADAVLYNFQADLLFRNLTDMTDLFGGNIGFGGMNDANVVTAWNTLTGAREVYVADDNIFSDNVTLMKKGVGTGGDPKQVPYAFAMGVVPADTVGDMPPGIAREAALGVQGIEIYHYAKGPKSHAVWAPMTADIQKTHSRMGVRIIDVVT